MDLSQFEEIDWDSEDDENGNLAHCLRHGVTEIVVNKVLSGAPVEIKMELETAEFAIVGPSEAEDRMWTLLFARSYKRGDWLRPITGWPSKPAEIAEWKRATG